MANGSRLVALAWGRNRDTPENRGTGTWCFARQRKAPRLVEAAMNRRSPGWRQPTRRSLLLREIARRKRARRLSVETLEDRHLLSSMVAIDPNQQQIGSLIVQFKSGVNAPGSLAAYSAAANLDPEWALTPGMRKVELDPRTDWQAALAAFRQDPNVAFAEPDYHVSLQ